MDMANLSLIEQLARLREQVPGVYPRDAARHLGVTECELVHADPGATALDAADLPALLSAIESLGEVMALARNDACVHELVGRYGNVQFEGKVGLAINEVIDLRFFLYGWAYAYALVTNDARGERRSLQFFDKHGTAIQKVFLRPDSDVAAFDALVTRFASGRSECRPEPAAPAPAELADSEIDAAAFQAEWLALRDVHGFHALLRRHRLSRRQAFRLAPPGQAWRVRTDAVEALLRRVAATQVPMMAFAGNGGVIQIHTGTIDRVEVRGNWLNILDPAFSLHLDMPKVAEAWVAHKPGEKGVVTSLELFDAAGVSLLTLFGERKGGHSERPEWRKLLCELAVLEGEDA